MLTLAQLQQTRTRDQWKAFQLAVLQVANLPITDWADGGVERTILEGDCEALEDLAQFIPAIVNGGLVDLAEGDWLTEVAWQLYKLRRGAASYTVGSIVLSDPNGAGPYTIAAGKLWVRSAAGRRYNNITGGTLAQNGSLTLLFQSESPNDSANGLNYVDGAGTITQLVTQLPGVAVINPASTFSAVVQTGAGSGAVTPTGSPVASHTVTVVISSTGQSGAATWTYSIDGGAPTPAGATSSVANAGGTGITITLANGSINPSFIAGDTYTWNNPGTWITQQGTDEESDATLRIRCKARWPDLSDVPTNSKYVLWALRASSQVTQVNVAADATVTNKVNITLAGQAGAVTAGVVAAVQAYVDARVDITDFPVASSAVTTAVTIDATVVLPARSLAAAQASIAAQLSSYINSSGIAGVVEMSEVIAILRSAPGVTNVVLNTVLINSASADLQIAAGHVAYTTQDFASTLTWMAS